jgi:hypothetical protein
MASTVVVVVVVVVAAAAVVAVNAFAVVVQTTEGFPNVQSLD